MRRPLRIRSNARLSLLLFALGVVIASGCSVGGRIQAPRTGLEQLLSTQAIDRAMDRIDWPDVADDSVRVLLGVPDEGQSVPSDREYLLRAVEVRLAERGARVVHGTGPSDRVLTVLVGSLGINMRGRFFGLQGTSGGLLPFTIPELALYKRMHREGFARAEIVLADPKAGGVLHRSGPVVGSTERTTTTLLFVFDFESNDLTPAEGE